VLIVLVSDGLVTVGVRSLRIAACISSWPGLSRSLVILTYEPTPQLFIPFDLDGVIASFHTRLPTAPELEDIDRHVELTSEVEWIPHLFATEHHFAEGDVN
jgi:hypothetical protein